MNYFELKKLALSNMLSQVAFIRVKDTVNTVSYSAVYVRNAALMQTRAPSRDISRATAMAPIVIPAATEQPIRSMSDTAAVAPQVKPFAAEDQASHIPAEAIVSALSAKYIEGDDIERGTAGAAIALYGSKSAAGEAIEREQDIGAMIAASRAAVAASGKNGSTGSARFDFLRHLGFGATAPSGPMVGLARFGFLTMLDVVAEGIEGDHCAAGIEARTAGLIAAEHHSVEKSSAAMRLRMDMTIADWGDTVISSISNKKISELTTIYI